MGVHCIMRVHCMQSKAPLHLCGEREDVREVKRSRCDTALLKIHRLGGMVLESPLGGMVLESPLGGMVLESVTPSGTDHPCHPMPLVI